MSNNNSPDEAFEGCNNLLEQLSAISQANLQYKTLVYYMLIIGLILPVIIGIWRIWFKTVEHIRLVTSVSGDTRHRNVQQNRKVAFFKRNILYSPLFIKRHNRPLCLFQGAIHIGSIPSRVVCLFLGFICTINVLFSVINIDWGGSANGAILQFRNRTGNLALFNLLPLLVCVARNNPLIRVFGVPYDVFNTSHRTLGRIIVLEVVAHTSAYSLNSIMTKGWDGFKTSFSVQFLFFGLFGTCAVIVISIQTIGPFRHASYETFKTIHFSLAIFFIFCTWRHLKVSDSLQAKILVAVIILWCLERGCRLARIVYGNIAGSGSIALIKVLPGHALNVTISMPRRWRNRPGQYAYIYIPAISFWQSHPFSVAWSLYTQEEMIRKGLENSTMTISFIIRARTGFTKALYEKVAACVHGELRIAGFVEGPYGSLYSIESYYTSILVAGGVGITHQLSHVRDLLHRHSQGTSATKRITLIWITKSPTHFEWVRHWITEITSMDESQMLFQLIIYISQPCAQDICMPPPTVEVRSGRPDIDRIFKELTKEQEGPIGVSVCGPGSLSDDVREAVRKYQYDNPIDLFDESFSQ